MSVNVHAIARTNGDTLTEAAARGDRALLQRLIFAEVTECETSSNPSVTCLVLGLL
jgi:hypothetical protein